MIDLVRNTTLKETRDITETSTTEDSQIDIIVAGVLQYLFSGNPLFDLEISGVEPGSGLTIDIVVRGSLLPC